MGALHHSIQAKITMRLFVLGCLFALLASGAECFPKAKSLLPRVLTSSNNDGTVSGNEESYHTIVGNDDFVIFGG